MVPKIEYQEIGSIGFFILVSFLMPADKFRCLHFLPIPSLGVYIHFILNLSAFAFFLKNSFMPRIWYSSLFHFVLL